MGRVRKKVKDPKKVGREKIRKVERVSKRDNAFKNRYRTEDMYVSPYEKIKLRTMQLNGYGKIVKTESQVLAVRENHTEVARIALEGIREGSYMLCDLISM